MKRIKPFVTVTLILFAILTITNPSYQRFINYCNETESDNTKINYQKRFDAFIFSIYLKKVTSIDEWENQHIDSTIYVGILLNFLKLKKN